MPQKKATESTRTLRASTTAQTKALKEKIEHRKAAKKKGAKHSGARDKANTRPLSAAASKKLREQQQNLTPLAIQSTKTTRKRRKRNKKNELSSKILCQYTE